MGDVETLSKKGQETKKIRKRVNAAGKKTKKPKKKVTVVDNEPFDEAVIEKMVQMSESSKFTNLITR